MQHHEEKPLLPPICPNLTVGPHCFCLNADIHSDDEDADEETDDDIHLDDEDAGHHHLCFHNSSIFSVKFITSKSMFLELTR